MAYKYDFDDRSRGDFEFPTETYRLIQEGLKGLQQEVETWNEKVRAHGAAPLYECESNDLGRMIAFGSEQLARKVPWVRVLGISVGSMRYYRAGMELILRRKRSELERNRVEGWPSAALESLQRSLKEVEKVASGLDVPPADVLWEVLPDHEAGEIALQMRIEAEEALWDAFISHASEDKDAFVRPLAEALKGAGLRIWYDEFSLRVGDSLRRSIDKGLSRARYGIVVLSPSFFAKEWPQKELDGLIAREARGQKVILPVWYNVDVVAVCQYSPTLADRVAIRSQNGPLRVAQDLLAVLKSDK